jgi:hypothetical protein
MVAAQNTENSASNYYNTLIYTSVICGSERGYEDVLIKVLTKVKLKLYLGNSWSPTSDLEETFPCRGRAAEKTNEDVATTMDFRLRTASEACLYFNY